MTGATRPLMVCLDLDGTTIDYDSVLHPEVRDAVLATSAAGHTVLIATGRTLMATLPLARELELTTGYLVCSNGAVVVRLHPELPDGHEIVEKVTWLRIAACSAAGAPRTATAFRR